MYKMIALTIMLAVTPISVGEDIQDDTAPVVEEVIVEEDIEPEPETTDLGEHKITYYCQYCNDGWGTSLGNECSEYIVAANPNVYPYGTKLNIEGHGEKVVGDYCGQAVRVNSKILDVYRTSNAGYCDCSGIEYRNVEVIE